MVEFFCLCRSVRGGVPGRREDGRGREERGERVQHPLVSKSKGFRDF